MNVRRLTAMALTMLGTAAHAQISIDYISMASVVAPEIVIGQVKVTALSAAGTPANVVLVNGEGLGVQGGGSDAMDYDERLIFTFANGKTCAKRVTYQTHDAEDGDCDGEFGETILKATDLTGVAFPDYEVYGRAGNHYQQVNRAARGAPVTGFEIHSKSTQIWVARLWADDLGDVTVVDFADMGTFTAASHTVGGVQIDAMDATGGAGALTFNDGYGLAVKGGTLGLNPDLRVSDFEALNFTFLGDKPCGVSVLYSELASTDNGDGDADGRYGESTVRPGRSGTSFEFFERAVSLDDWIEPRPISITAAAGGAEFNMFRLETNYYHPTCPTTGNLDSFRVEKLAYCTPVPSMECDADCNGDGVLNILDFVCFQEKFVAGCP